MEDKFFIANAGQEFGKNDVNLIAEEAALADDRILAELIRLRPLGSPTRGILPPSHGSSPLATSSVVVPSGSADAQVQINPFRAVIGPISPASGIDALRNSRSAISVGAATMPQLKQFPAATNNRWDLLYAVVSVEIDGPSMTRYQKTSGSPAIATAVTTTKQTTVKLAVLPGTEATTPTRPTIPADSGSNYYIPLAYVLLPAGHTLGAAIPAANIHECAPVLALSRATGANTMRVASGMSSTSGIAVANEGWTPATGRPQAFLPATMSGGESLFAALHEASATRTIALGATGILDNSTDWRRRAFKVTACLGGSTLMWRTQSPSSLPRSGDATVVRMSNSFFADFGGTRAALMSLSSAMGGGMNPAATVVLYVDMADGAIKCDVGATSPDIDFCFWIEATAQFNNAF